MDLKIDFSEVGGGVRIKDQVFDLINSASEGVGVGRFIHGAGKKERGGLLEIRATEMVVKFDGKVIGRLSTDVR